MLFALYLGTVLCYTEVNFIHRGEIFDFWNRLQFITWEVMGKLMLVLSVVGLKAVLTEQMRVVN
jgi:hypothetical protein